MLHAWNYVRSFVHMPDFIRNKWKQIDSFYRKLNKFEYIQIHKFHT